jgi:hypothetical protein
VEGEEEADGDDADLFAAGDQPVDGLLDGLDAAAHRDDHALGLGMTMVFEQMVGPAGHGGEAVHRGLDDAGERIIEAVHGLAALEIDVGFCAVPRMVGRSGDMARARKDAMSSSVDDRADVIASESMVIFCASCEVRKPSKKWMKGMRAVARGVRDQGEVVRLLHRVAAQQGAAGGAAGHDVRVIAEDRQALGGERAGAHVQGQRQQFARDLVEIGNHQQQALRGREGRRERAPERPPCTAPAAPPSDCISTTRGISPHRFGCVRRRPIHRRTRPWPRKA